MAEPDEMLLARVRAGDGVAYGAFYRRHAGAVRRYARVCCADTHLAEDLTAEVFARTLRALRSGAGPNESARAYLLTTVRRVAAQWGAGGRREQPVADLGDLAAQHPATQHPAESAALIRAADRSMAARAFHSLPERWQEVLWHTAVEQQPLSRVGPLLGLTPNATAVLAFRAREGLREAYLQAHVNSALTGQAGCRQHATRLGAFARKPMRRRGYRQLRHHLQGCERCRSAYLELVDINATLRGLVPAALVGWLAAARLMGGTAQAAGAVHATHVAAPLGAGLAAELIPAGPGIAHAGGALAKLVVGAAMAIATGAAAAPTTPHAPAQPPPAAAPEHGARQYGGDAGTGGGGGGEGTGRGGEPFSPVVRREPPGERTGEERMVPRARTAVPDPVATAAPPPVTLAATLPVAEPVPEAVPVPAPVPVPESSGEATVPAVPPETPVTPGTPVGPVTPETPGSPVSPIPETPPETQPEPGPVAGPDAGIQPQPVPEPPATDAGSGVPDGPPDAGTQPEPGPEAGVQPQPVPEPPATDAGPDVPAGPPDAGTQPEPELPAIDAGFGVPAGAPEE
ncbi:sigma-70 family RNA polymerase sigma factor [Streptomyces sp. NPDC049879]|uniref:sigma-70 family RNA polymerase sigma factor n=1 Tax=Streptomyces sp. NPDC049879 TaxID=3365598 RepID=UPI00379F8AB1